MDRAQFMEQLKRLLSDISPAERQEALDYYENYFDDAGPENEAAVIRELGSPGKVAAIIKDDLEAGADQSCGEYTERGYEDTRRNEDQFPEQYDSHSRKEEENTSDSHSSCRSDREQTRSQRGYRAREKNNTKGILLLILVVFLSPFIVGGVGSAFGILVAVILCPFLVLFGIGAAGIGLGIGGIACIAAGIPLLFTYSAEGVLVLGIGCILLGISILLILLTIWGAGKFMPWLLRKITDLGNRLLNRKRKEGTQV